MFQYACFFDFNMEMKDNVLVRLQNHAGSVWDVVEPRDS
jgi:hypothetical protein